MGENIEQNKQKYPIYCDENSTKAAAILRQAGYQIGENIDGAKIIWIRRNYKRSLSRLIGGQAVNHIPNEQIFTNKGNLTELLHRYDRFTSSSGFNSGNFYRQSYLFREKENREYFADTISQDKSEDNLWVIKPTGSSKGRGIKILTALQIKDRYVNKNTEDCDIIVQRHINNPLLFRSRKSEFRIYWTFLSISPLVVALYTDGIMRYCSEPFALEDFANPLKHITNIYQQKKHQKTFEELDLKITLASACEELYSQGLVPQQFIEQHLWPKLADMLAYIVKASRQHIINDPIYIRYKNKLHFFGFFGCDIMLDDQLNPWLLEVQKGPGLSFNDNEKAKVIIPALAGGIEMLTQILQKTNITRPPAKHTLLEF